MSCKSTSHVTHERTFPNAERTAGIAAETGIALAVVPLGEKASIAAMGALEAADFRGGVEGVVRELTADKTIHYTDKSKDVITHHGLGLTKTGYSSEGQLTDRATVTGSATTHTQYDAQGKPASTTVYTSDGGNYRYDASGKLEQSQCVIL